MRYRVLRQPLGLQFDEKDLAAENQQVHIGAFVGEKVVGCLILVIVDENTLKMRQVAVDPEMQRQGIGQKMVSYSELYAIEKGFCKIELHARQTAIHFYLDLAYHITGDPFLEVGIPHRKMVKDWCSAIGH